MTALLWTFYVGLTTLCHHTVFSFKPFEGVFYEVKPFIYRENGDTNDSGELKGMIVEYFRQLKEIDCIGRNTSAMTPFINFKTNLGDERVNWTTTWTTKKLQNNSDLFLFPYLEWQNEGGGVATEVFSTKGLAVITKRDYISFMSKLLRALYNFQYTVFVFYCALGVGLLHWLFVSVLLLLL